MHQESKENLSLKASRINLPSEHNSLTLFTLKSWTSAKYIWSTLKPKFEDAYKSNKSKRKSTSFNINHDIISTSCNTKYIFTEIQMNFFYIMSSMASPNFTAVIKNAWNICVKEREHGTMIQRHVSGVCSQGEINIRLEEVMCLWNQQMPITVLWQIVPQNHKK